MGVYQCLSPKSRRRCGRLLQRGLQILITRKGDRAHSHVLWLGLISFLALVGQFGEVAWWLLPSVALFVGLAVIVLFDVEYLVIPDGPVLILSAVGLAMLATMAPLAAAVRLLAALAAWSLMRTSALAYERWRGVAGLGAGDAKLFGLAGLWLGFPGLPGCLTIAAFSGLLSALLLMRGGRWRDPREPIPFAPHLALGFWLVWAIGPLEFG